MKNTHTKHSLSFFLVVLVLCSLLQLSEQQMPCVLEGSNIFLSPLDCSGVTKFDLPVTFDWSSSQDGIAESGFTMVLPSSSYNPATIQRNAPSLILTTTPGSMREGENVQANILGIGLDLPYSTLRLSTVIDLPNSEISTGAASSASLWFGNKHNDHIQISAEFSGGAITITGLIRKMGVVTQLGTAVQVPGSTQSIRLVMDVFPTLATAKLSYQLDQDFEICLSTALLPPSWIGITGEILDQVGSNSFAGIFVEKNDNLEPSEFAFAEFSALPLSPPYNTECTQPVGSQSPVDPSPSSSVPLTLLPSLSPFVSISNMPSEQPAVALDGCNPVPSQFQNRPISTLPCPMIKPVIPFNLVWNGTDLGGLTDANGVGTGLRMVLPVAKENFYKPHRFRNVPQGLQIYADSGTASGTLAVSNCIGVGVDLPGEVVILNLTISDIPMGTGNGESVGVFFGISQTNYLKIVVENFNNQNQRIRYQKFFNGVSAEARNLNYPQKSVDLSITFNPNQLSVRVVVNGNPWATFNSVPSQWFNADAAGVDFEVGTRAFTCIITSTENRPESAGPIAYTLKSYSLSHPVEVGFDDTESTVDFNLWDFQMSFPTGFAFGPDGKLYVTNALGVLSEVTLDYTARTASIRTIANMNSLDLGITIDPSSTPDKVILWVAGSDITQDGARPNSGKVTRLEGPDFVPVEIVTGLPRSYSNHATNGLKFGPDGMLYVSQSGNSGAGAPNDGNSEFAGRPEQPLTGTILRFDVSDLNRRYSCISTTDADGVIMDATGISANETDCWENIYCTGLRNVYDIWFHSNGQLYAPENGLGVEGTFPKLLPSPLEWVPETGCEGKLFGEVERNTYNPGTREDTLHLIEQGMYYGAPNPSRRECIFGAGNPINRTEYSIPGSGGETVFLGTTKYPLGLNPHPKFRKPIYSLGQHKSANGIIEYKSDVFCGDMQGDLLITYYSITNQVRRLQMSADGKSVIRDMTMKRSSISTGGRQLNNPLPIAEGPLGHIVVGQFLNGLVIVFEPKINCWQQNGIQSSPVALSNSGSAMDANGNLYLVGGMSATGAVKTLNVFNSRQNTWGTGPALPAQYPAVRNAAVVHNDGFIYSFGGIQQNGQVTNQAARYDISMNQWMSLPMLPVARGGASAVVAETKIYVIGGVNSQGASMTDVNVYDIVAGTWQSVASLSDPRGFASAMWLADHIYVIGGRATATQSLATGEMYNPITNQWSPIAPMKKARSSAVGQVVGSYIVMSGGIDLDSGLVEKTAEVFNASENEWTDGREMPVPKYGAAFGYDQGRLFVATGSTSTDVVTDSVAAYKYVPSS